MIIIFLYIYDNNYYEYNIYMNNVITMIEIKYYYDRFAVAITHCLIKVVLGGGVDETPIGY